MVPGASSLLVVATQPWALDPVVSSQWDVVLTLSHPKIVGPAFIAQPASLLEAASPFLTNPAVAMASSDFTLRKLEM